MTLTTTNDAATIGSSEYSLPTDSTTLTPQTTDGRVWYKLDCSAMAAGDQFRVRAYETVNGGSMLPFIERHITGLQSELVSVDLGIVSTGWQCTLKKIAGTDRSLGWTQNIDTPGGDATAANQTTILGRLPAALVSGRIDASVGAMAADVLTAAATAADFTTEVTSGLATAANQTTILGRLPAALVSGRIDAAVGALAADVITAAATAADFTTEVTAGLATAANQTTILGRLPAALVSGRIDASVGAMAADVITAAAAAADFTTEVTAGLGTAANQSTIISALATIASYIDTEIGSIKTTVEALPSAATIATAVLAATIHTGYSVARALRLIGAAAAGKLSGASTAAPVHRYMDDSGDAITGTTTADGRTTAVHGA